MEDRIYDYWAASLQDGYIGNLIGIVESAGGSRALYETRDSHLESIPGISEKLAAYIIENRPDLRLLEKEYFMMNSKGVCYVNHTDPDYPERLKSIPSPPYGLFVKGSLPDPYRPAAAIVGARQCSEYGRLMAEYLGTSLAKEGINIISGMAWGIDGISQFAALSAGGRSYAVLGCGVDIPYPSKNRVLYNKLCEDDSGIISEYAPGTSPVARLFPPRNRIISGLCDVLIVVEARQKSGTLITVDMAIDQGKCVMVVPGRLTDNLSAGCLNLISQGALPVTGIGSVLEQLNMKIPEKRGKTRNKPIGSITVTEKDIPEELQCVANILSLEPQSAETIANNAKLPLNAAMIMLTKLDLEGCAREVWPGYFVKNVTIT